MGLGHRYLMSPPVIAILCWLADPILTNLQNEGFDSLWLFAVDTGGGRHARQNQFRH